jgi:hypothetical protein
MGQAFAGSTSTVHHPQTVLPNAWTEDVEFLVRGSPLRIRRPFDSDSNHPDRLQEVAVKVADPTALLACKERRGWLLSLLSRRSSPNSQADWAPSQAPSLPSALSGSYPLCSNGRFRVPRYDSMDVTPPEPIASQLRRPGASSNPDVRDPNGVDIELRR